MKLAIILRYLASGTSHASLQYKVRVARNTISLLVKEVCEAWVLELMNDVNTCPVDRGTWQQVAEELRSAEISHMPVKPWMGNM